MLVVSLVGEVMAKSEDSAAAATLERQMLGYLLGAAGGADASATTPRADADVNTQGSSSSHAPSRVPTDAPQDTENPAPTMDEPNSTVAPSTNADTSPSPHADAAPAPAPAPSPTSHARPMVRRLIWGVSAMLLIGAGVGLWWWLQPATLGDGFVSGNGRIEAVEIDVASKGAGRVTAVLVDEGDFVSAGQVIAQMDATVLTAQKQEALARHEQARSAVITSESQVALRESERVAARAVVTQREAELDVARKRAARSETLSLEGATSIQEFDDDRARVESASAAIAAARAQVAASDAAIATARSQVLGSRASAQAVASTVDRLTADIDDLTLTAPRDGRVQYRVTEAGEVVGAGGKVVNMIDVSDVYLTFFVAETVAGRVAIGSEVHIVLDAAPQYVLPASVTYVASTAQFTPKTVETASERQKLMFKVKANIHPELLQEHLKLVKTGVPGVAWLKLDPNAVWPASLEIRVPQ
jgi:HlyD family secretion protein